MNESSINPALLEIWLRSHALLAEIDGMRSQNETRRQLDMNPAYGDGDFNEKASALRALADSARQYHHDASIPRGDT
jgi:hypothetical protein